MWVEGVCADEKKVISRRRARFEPTKDGGWGWVRVVTVGRSRSRLSIERSNATLSRASEQAGSTRAIGRTALASILGRSGVEAAQVQDMASLVSAAILRQGEKKVVNRPEKRGVRAGSESRVVAVTNDQGSKGPEVKCARRWTVSSRWEGGRALALVYRLERGQRAEGRRGRGRRKEDSAR